VKPPRNIEIKLLHDPAQFRKVVELQRTIWGFEEVDLLPVRFFIVASKIGGQAFGAFDGERMVAFCIALPGIRRQGPHSSVTATSYLHSHMLGVLAEYRDYGIGRMLKFKQREEALWQGVDLIEWTFDPLELKNAYFNIERLGCIVRRYVRDQYGTTSSRLQAGLPTDRCTAEWWISSERVDALLANQPAPRPAIEARIAIPSNIGEIKRTDPQRARAIQSDAAQRFLTYFEQGLAVVGFEKSHAAGTYLLGQWRGNA
jgi:predicted GNAT superfamily acetyltransferase